MRLPESLLRPLRMLILLGLLALPAGTGIAAETRWDDGSFRMENERVTLALRDVPIAEVMEMLSRHGRVNVLLSDGVDGEISLNLFDVEISHAIRVIAEAAGYALEYRNETYFVISREDVGKYAAGGTIVTRAFPIQYSNVQTVAGIVEESLSHFGKVTTLAERGILIVQDLPDFVERIEDLLSALDHEPRQILIEVKILQITLDDSQDAGVNWTRFFDQAGGNTVETAGTTGLDPGGTGLFYSLVTPDLSLTLTALEQKGRLRTISRPTLLALENREANVIVGDRLGYRVTTTTNNITTESVEFIDSGVILRVTPAIDREGRIRLSIHPQVSTGAIQNGIPSINTTEVSTELLVPNGKTTFIGGLLRQTATEDRDGVPFLNDIPLIGGLFSRESKTNLRTETIALITPHIVDADLPPPGNAEHIGKADETEQIFEGERKRIGELLDNYTSGWLSPNSLRVYLEGEQADTDPPVPNTPATTDEPAADTEPAATAEPAATIPPTIQIEPAELANASPAAQPPAGEENEPPTPAAQLAVEETPSVAELQALQKRLDLLRAEQETTALPDE